MKPIKKLHWTQTPSGKRKLVRIVARRKARKVLSGSTVASVTTPPTDFVLNTPSQAQPTREIEYSKDKDKHIADLQQRLDARKRFEYQTALEVIAHLAQSTIR